MLGLVAKVRVRARVRARVRTVFERRSGDRTRVDGVCDLGGGYVPTTVTRLVRCDKRV